MPTPRAGESRDDFVERCIPVVLDDGTAKDSDQAVAVCSSMWREAQGGKAMQALKFIDATEDELILEGPIVLYGGRDITKEYFHKATKLDSSYTATGRLMIDWEHGLMPDRDEHGKQIPQPGRDDVLGYVDWLSVRDEDMGRLAKHVLNRREKYVSLFIEPLARAGLLGTSSEAIESKIVKSADGRIDVWPIKRQSLTVMPCEPRTMTEHQLQVIKSLTEAHPELKGLFPSELQQKPQPEGEPQGVGETQGSDGRGADATKSTVSVKETKMEEEKETSQTVAPTIDVAAIAREAAEEAVKAYQASLPEVDKSGHDVKVVEDEADRALKGNPYKGLGEFLMDIANAKSGPSQKRLQPLYTPDGYSLDKAMGREFIGSLYDAHQKSLAIKQTGMAEGTGPAGGFLVGTDRQGGILARVYDVGSLLQRTSMFPLSANSNSMTFNAEAETTRVDGGRRGGVRAYWKAEGALKVASRPVFRQIKLELNKVIGLVYATDELLQDASSLEAYIMRILPEELRFVVEDTIINGTGAGQPLGILASGALVTVAAEVGQPITTLVSENIINMWARMWAPSRRNAIWLINQDVEPQLYQFTLAVGTGGSVVYMPPGGLSQAPYGTLFGRPVIPSEYCSTLGTVGDILLVDLSEYYMIEKGMQSASSIHVNFLYDETVFRFVYRVDGQPAWAAPLTPHTGSANTLSPFVTLAGRP